VCGMRIAVEILKTKRWTLTESRGIAEALLGSPTGMKPLIPLLFSADSEMRVRSADVARRLTERDETCLSRFADEIIGALGELSLEESRARWHLVLAAARSAHTASQINRLAPMLLRMMDESSNVLRCSAIEGLAILALRDPALRPAALDVCYAAQSSGTTAMAHRALHALKKLRRVEIRR
jgi:hypothetical protein